MAVGAISVMWSCSFVSASCSSVNLCQSILCFQLSLQNALPKQWLNVQHNSTEWNSRPLKNYPDCLPLNLAGSALLTKNTQLDLGSLWNKWSVQPPSGVVSWLRYMEFRPRCSHQDAVYWRIGVCVWGGGQERTQVKSMYPGVHSCLMEDRCGQMLKGIPFFSRHTCVLTSPPKLNAPLQDASWAHPLCLLLPLMKH